MLFGYHDNREGRVKPFPDCAAVGCVWNEDTQRCERHKPGGLGFISPLFGGSDAAGFNWYGNNSGIADYYNAFNAGSSFAQSGSDEPGWNLWEVFDLALDLGYDEDFALMIAGGLVGDPGQYLGPDFETIETWEPSALPASQQIPIYIPTPQGIPGPNPAIFRPDADDVGDIPARPLPSLPGYCPNGTYHPANDPQACVPFPQDATARRAAQKAKAQQGRAQQRRAGQLTQPCPSGQARYPYTGQCAPLQCPAGTARNQATGQCVKAPGAAGAAIRQAAAQCPPGTVYDSTARRCTAPGYGDSSSSSSGWLWLLLAAGALLAIRRS